MTIICKEKLTDELQHLLISCKILDEVSDSIMFLAGIDEDPDTPMNQVYCYYAELVYKLIKEYCDINHLTISMSYDIFLEYVWQQSHNNNLYVTVNNLFKTLTEYKVPFAE